MSKSKRSKAKFQRAKNVQQNVVTSKSSSTPVDGARVARTVAVGTQTISTENRYKYITSDLRNIAIIAGALIVLLFVLTFFIQ
ncbi:MAG TPA: hypothetical protein DCX22_01450 [Dehalococcoidia bacterium]|nr:hypothetical protein [Dehalococcoidia bacterium]